MAHSYGSEMTPDPALLANLRQNDPDIGPGDLDEALFAAKSLAARWAFTPEGALPGATCSLVFGGLRAGKPAVLKVPVIGEEATSGAAAARAFGGCGGVPIWESDEATGALLMPCLDGGDLGSAGMADRAGVEVAIALMQRLRSAPSFAAMSAETYFSQELADDRAEAAWRRQLLGQLIASTERPERLHGDLHHFNILRQGSGWVAIDPKGVLADPAYEPAAFLRNPIPNIGEDHDLEGTLGQRIERFASGLGLSPRRIWAWAWVQTDAAAEEGPPAWRAVADALARLSQRFGPWE